MITVEENDKNLDNKDIKKEMNESPNHISIWQLFSTATTNDAILMSIGSLAAGITGACLPAFCVIFGRMIDALNDGGSIEDAVNRVSIIFVILGLINLVSGLIQVVCWSYAGERQAQRLRLMYVQSVLRQDIGWFDSCGASELNTIVTELTGKVRDGITKRTGDMIQFLAQFIVSFIAALYLNWRLAVVLIATFPLIAASGTYMIQAVTSAQNESSDQYAKAGGVASEALMSIRTVSALNAQPYFISQYRKHIIEAMNIGIKKSFKVGLGNGLTFCVSFFTYALGFWYGAKLVADQLDNNCSHDCYTGGTIVAVFFCVIVGATALGQISPPLTVFFTAKAAAGSMMKTISRKPLIDGLSDDGERPIEKPRGCIEIRDVIFAYPSRPHINVCNNYNLIINPGETVALCGPSGAGKSTIINLLLRFYDPTLGCLSLDGRDIRSLNIKWLRSMMGYVGQEPVLFAGSVFDNIAYGIDREIEENLSDEEIRLRVETAARQANAHLFINSFPQGYQTEVGGNGFALSGGQKQRIAIARALVKKPAVLLLDEATSALDTASEKLVQKSIDELQRSHSQTTIVIAHRLSTIRHADKIAVIDGGRVVELGTHDELLVKNGLYADLVKLQMTTAGDDMITAYNQSIRNLAQSNAIDNDDELEVMAQKISLAKQMEESAAAAKRLADQSIANIKLNDKEKRKAKAKESLEKETLNHEEAAKLRSKIFHLVKPYTPWLLLGLFGAALVGSAFPQWGLLLAESENMFYLEADEMRKESVRIAVRFIYLGIECFIGYILQFYCIGQVGHRVVTTLRSDLFESFFRREISFFDHKENSVGILTSNLAEDTRLIHESTSETFANQLQATFTLVVGLVIGFTASWKISLIVIATFPLNIFSAALRAKVRTGSYEDTSDSMNASGPLASAFTHMRTISAFSMQKKLGDIYAKATEASAKIRRQQSYFDGFSLGLMNAIMFFTYALLFWYGSKLVVEGEISFKQLMTAILGLLLGSLGLGQALNDIGSQTEGLLAAKRIFSNIDESKISKIDGLSRHGMVPADNLTKGKIELKNLMFRYPTRPDAPVCNDYNLTINQGELVALVGPSGSGKSTIMSMLLRFYDPMEGNVYMDGVDIKTMDIRWLRSQIGYVGQEPVLFGGSIAENIVRGRQAAADDLVLPLSEIIHEDPMSVCPDCNCYPYQLVNKHDAVVHDIETGGKQDPTIPYDVIEASKLANGHDFIQSFTSQYYTDVGEGSIMVSGGQKQRIAIARALVKKPAVLLLDEATSALDTASEKLVQKSIDELQRSHSQTTIVIAHRLSTIRHADKIAVIDGGRVVELGTHDELLVKNGLYAQLCEKQAGVEDKNSV